MWTQLQMRAQVWMWTGVDTDAAADTCRRRCVQLAMGNPLQISCEQCHVWNGGAAVTNMVSANTIHGPSVTDVGDGDVDKHGCTVDSKANAHTDVSLTVMRLLMAHHVYDENAHVDDQTTFRRWAARH